VVPGFENFNTRVRQPGGFHLPNAAKERVWNTPNGMANFSAAPLVGLTAAEGRFLLQTLRSHDQFNTTVYGLDDRYRGISGMRDIVFLNPEDLAALGVKPGGRIDLTSHWHDGERHLNGFRAIPYDMPRGMAAAYFPEANVLVPAGHVAEGSNTPASKSIEVSIRPAQATRPA
jgi:anaerobic selenocysteine-containing dehydrogenase